MPKRHTKQSRSTEPTARSRLLDESGLVRVATLMSLPTLLHEYGVDSSRVLAEFGLQPAYFDEPDNTFSVATRFRLMARCAEVCRCPHFGLLVGERGNISALGPVGFLMQSSPNVRAALEVMSRHFWVHNPKAAAELDEYDSFGVFRYTVLQPGTDGEEVLLDGAAAMMLNIMRSLCGHYWKPTEVHLARRRPRRLKPYRQFFDAPLVFDAEETSLIFDAYWLDKRLPSADPLLHLMMEHRIAELEAQRRHDLASQLRRILPSLLSSRDASVTVAAKRLGLGVRTMHRRLLDEGTSFTQLREEVRFAMARALLQDTRIPAHRISDRLGYANASAFSYAFRRWSGMSPAQWRVARCRRRGTTSRCAGNT